MRLPQSLCSLAMTCVFEPFPFFANLCGSLRLCVENPLTFLYLAWFFSKIAPLLSLVNIGAANSLPHRIVRGAQ